MPPFIQRGERGDFTPGPVAERRPELVEASPAFTAPQYSLSPPMGDRRKCRGSVWGALSPRLCARLFFGVYGLTQRCQGLKGFNFQIPYYLHPSMFMHQQSYLICYFLCVLRDTAVNLSFFDSDKTDYAANFLISTSAPFDQASYWHSPELKHMSFFE